MYSVNELSTLIPDPANPGNYFGWSRPFAINEKGLIVGESESPQGNSRAVLWQGQTIQDLGTLQPDPNNPGQFFGDSRAYDINKSGTIVGISYHGNLGNQRAFVWRGGKMTELKPPTRVSIASAHGINNQGTVVGYCEDSPGNSQACMWDPLGVIKVLGIPPPHAGFVGRWSSALGINDKDEVIVVAGDYTSLPPAPYLWRNGSWIPLFNSIAELGNPTAINNRSEVVGERFRWNPNTGRHNLNATADAISEVDLIVGGVPDRINFRTAVLIWFNGGTVDLNTLIPANANWYLQWALGVNSDGWIVGSGKRNGRQRGFLLMPEPQFDVTINTTASVTKVLGGVAAGGGGIGIQLGNPIPFPIPPWGPEFHLLPDLERLPVTAQDVAAALSLLATAHMIGNPDLRNQITEIARQLGGDRIETLGVKGSDSQIQ